MNHHNKNNDGKWKEDWKVGSLSTIVYYSGMKLA